MDIGLAKIEIIYNHTVTCELHVYWWHTALSKYIWWAGVIFGHVWPDLHRQFPSGQMWLAQFCWCTWSAWGDYLVCQLWVWDRWIRGLSRVLSAQFQFQLLTFISLSQGSHNHSLPFLIPPLRPIQEQSRWNTIQRLWHIDYWKVLTRESLIRSHSKIPLPHPLHEQCHPQDPSYGQEIEPSPQPYCLVLWCSTSGLTECLTTLPTSLPERRSTDLSVTFP